MNMRPRRISRDDNFVYPDVTRTKKRKTVNLPSMEEESSAPKIMETSTITFTTIKAPDIKEIKTYTRTYKLTSEEEIDQLIKDKNNDFEYDMITNKETSHLFYLKQIADLNGKLGVFTCTEIEEGTLLGYVAGTPVEIGEENEHSKYISEIKNEEGRVIAFCDSEKERDWTAFLKHSQNSNVYTKPVKVGNEYKVGIYTTKKLKMNTHLISNYGVVYFIKDEKEIYLDDHSSSETNEQRYLKNKEFYEPYLVKLSMEEKQNLGLTGEYFLVPKLIAAIDKNDISQLKKILNLKYSTPDLYIYACDENGMLPHQEHLTPAMYASFRGRKDCFNLLKQAGANTDACTLHKGFTCFSLLLMGNTNDKTVTEFGRELLQNTDYPFIYDSEFRSYLHYAIQRNSLDLIKDYIKISEEEDQDPFFTLVHRRPSYAPHADFDFCLLHSQFEILEFLLLTLITSIKKKMDEAEQGESENQVIDEKTLEGNFINYIRETIIFRDETLQKASIEQLTHLKILLQNRAEFKLILDKPVLLQRINNYLELKQKDIIIKTQQEEIELLRKQKDEEIELLRNELREQKQRNEQYIQQIEADNKLFKAQLTKDELTIKELVDKVNSMSNTLPQITTTPTSNQPESDSSNSSSSVESNDTERETTSMEIEKADMQIDTATDNEGEHSPPRRLSKRRMDGVSNSGNSLKKQKNSSQDNNNNTIATTLLKKVVEKSPLFKLDVTQISSYKKRKYDLACKDHITALEKEIKRANKKYKYDRKTNSKENNPTSISQDLMAAPVYDINGGWGIFTKKRLHPGESIVAYYAGYRSKDDSDEDEQSEHVFGFNKLQTDITLDGAKIGDWTSLINGVQNPNVVTEERWINGEPHICYKIAMPIEERQQLFINYDEKYEQRLAKNKKDKILLYLRPHDNWKSPTELYNKALKHGMYAEGVYEFDEQTCKDLHLVTNRGLVPSIFELIASPDLIDVEQLQKFASNKKIKDPLELCAYACDDQSDQPKILEPRKQQHLTPLMYACYVGNETAIKFLLAQDAYPNGYMQVQGFGLVTLLLIGRAQKKEDDQWVEELILKLLKDHIACPFVKDRDGLTIFHYAIKRNLPQVVERIIRLANEGGKKSDQSYLYDMMFGKDNNAKIAHVDVDYCILHKQFDVLEILLKDMINKDVLEKYITDGKVLNDKTLIAFQVKDIQTFKAELANILESIRNRTGNRNKFSKSYAQKIIKLITESNDHKNQQTPTSDSKSSPHIETGNSDKEESRGEAAATLKVDAISMSEIRDKLQAFMLHQIQNLDKKHKMNYGYLAKLSILALTNLLKGKPIQSNIMMETVGNIPNKIELRKTKINAIKSEDATNINEDITANNNSIHRIHCALFNRGGNSINSLIPPQTYPCIDLETGITSSVKPKDHVVGVKVNINNLNEELKRYAKTQTCYGRGSEENRIVLGQIVIISKQINSYNLLVFCATPTNVFYIDPQMIKKNKSIFFSDLAMQYPFESTSYLSSEYFLDDVFYCPIKTIRVNHENSVHDSQNYPNLNEDEIIRDDEEISLTRKQKRRECTSNDFAKRDLETEVIQESDHEEASTKKMK
jgi:ankyrin repeat protein